MKKFSKFTPKETKFAKLHKGNTSLIEYRKGATNPIYHSCSLITLKETRFEQAYMEITRLRLARSFRQSRDMVWTRINTSIPITKKPNQNRMGKGKGSIATWVARIPAGRILLETSSKIPNRAFLLAKIIAKTLKVPSFIRNNKPIFAQTNTTSRIIGRNNPEMVFKLRFN